MCKAPAGHLPESGGTIWIKARGDDVMSILYVATTRFLFIYTKGKRDCSEAELFAKCIYR